MLNLNLNGQISHIHLQQNWQNLPAALSAAGLTGKSAVIITDKTVARLYLKEVSSILSSHFQNITSHIMKPGEASKNFTALQDVLTTFHRAGLDKTSTILALGGGVVSDLAGLAAAIYMRGIPYVVLPTTLLAQVDSSIGGKTGIDFLGVKNLVGCFHQPSVVYSNPAALSSLPHRDYVSGLAEVVKYGIIKDNNLFDILWEHRRKIAVIDQAILEKIIRACCMAKADIVQLDERDTGPRQILNYGHTFGHAIESLCNFTMPHGHCVALGIMCAAAYSSSSGGMSKDEVEKIRALLSFFGLPVILPKTFALKAQDIYNMMGKDKKAKDGAITLIISHSIGTAQIHKNAKKDAVLAAIQTIMKE